MQTSQGHHSSGGVHRFYNQHAQEITPYYSFNNMASDNATNGTQMSFQAYDQPYNTLDSIPPASVYNMYNSPSFVSTSSNRSQYSPQGSQSYLSDPHHSSGNNYGSPMSGSSMVDGDTTVWRNSLQDLELLLMEEPDSDVTDSSNCSLISTGGHEADLDQLRQMVSGLDLKKLLEYCAQAIDLRDLPKAEVLIEELVKRGNVTGTFMERLVAYMVEALRSRKEFSGYKLYKKLRCEYPPNSDLLSYMHVLYEFCPYYKFAYMSSNIIILEAMQNERSIHIIDFQIAMGSQWILLFDSLANLPGGPPFVRITGVDDEHSAYARGGGLEVVGRRLSEAAQSRHIPFQFHAAAMSGCKVKKEDLRVQPGEALAVNFPYMLHHMPDEGVSISNHRDRLLELVKNLSPKIVTLVEQESNTNSGPFLKRFRETLDYYTAMFESVEAGKIEDPKRRIKAEMHCIARDIVNMLGCEGDERLERHELFSKWQSRLQMAGYEQLPLSSSVITAMVNLLKNFDKNYFLQLNLGALYLGWKTRPLVTCSAWK